MYFDSCTAITGMNQTETSVSRQEHNPAFSIFSDLALLIEISLKYTTKSWFPSPLETICFAEFILIFPV